MDFIHLVYVLLIVFALFTVFASNLKRAIVGSSVFGLWMSFAYMLYHAPDVAIAEAVISSSLSTILYIITIKNYDDIGVSSLGRVSPRNVVAFFCVAVCFGLVFVLTHVTSSVDFTVLGVMVMESYFARGGGVNPIGNIFLNYRIFDTIFEALMLLISGIGVVHLVRSSGDDSDVSVCASPSEDDPWREAPDFGKAKKYCYYKCSDDVVDSKHSGKSKKSITLRNKKHPSAVLTISFMMPILILVSIYLIVSDPIAPGGGFQGGALLSATFVSHYLIMPDHPVSTKFLNSFEKFVFLMFVAVAVLYVLFGLQTMFPQFYYVYFTVVNILLGVKVFCGLSIMFICFSREHNKV